MAKERSRKKPEHQVKIAKERIQILFDEAEKVKVERPELAKRYVKLAKKIGMRFNVHIPKHLKRKYCKYCYSYFVFGRNATHRLKRGIVNIKCLNCNKTIRYPYKKIKM
ncbi:MAG: ribonuclease P protein component 4 [Candidatus Aenigmatarchaeota archaeon]